VRGARGAIAGTVACAGCSCAPRTAFEPLTDVCSALLGVRCGSVRGVRTRAEHDDFRCRQTAPPQTIESSWSRIR